MSDHKETSKIKKDDDLSDADIVAALKTMLETPPPFPGRHTRRMIVIEAIVVHLEVKA
jgi:hypothetical protein